MPSADPPQMREPEPNKYNKDMGYPNIISRAACGQRRASIRRTPASLHKSVVWTTFLVTLLGMGIYTLVEFVIDPPRDLASFLAHHLIHVAVIGLAVWIASVMVIRRLVIEPVNHVFIHLHRMASGRLDYLDVEVETTELEGVVTSVNELVAKLRDIPAEDAVSRALDHIRQLRPTLRGALAGCEDEAVPVMRLITKLEGDLLEIMQQQHLPGEPRSI